MNKILTALIAVIALVALSACGGSKMTKPMKNDSMKHDSMMK